MKKVRTGHVNKGRAVEAKKTARAKVLWRYMTVVFKSLPGEDQGRGKVSRSECRLFRAW